MRSLQMIPVPRHSLFPVEAPDVVEQKKGVLAVPYLGA